MAGIHHSSFIIHNFQKSAPFFSFHAKWHKPRYNYLLCLKTRLYAFSGFGGRKGIAKLGKVVTSAQSGIAKLGKVVTSP
jgi:hypothetical protein